MKELTKPERELLIQKNQQFIIAKGGFDEFVQFLQKQHDCEGCQLSKDGKRFIEPETKKKA